MSVATRLDNIITSPNGPIEEEDKAAGPGSANLQQKGQLRSSDRTLSR